MLTSDLFENKTPAAWRAGYERGLRYYRQGPDNPYPSGSEEAKDYADGYHNGELDSYDKYDTSTMNEGSGESYIIVRTDREGKKDVFAGNFDTYERAQKELDGLLAHPLHTKYKQKFEIKRKGGEQGVTEVSKATLDRYVEKAVDAHGHADFAARQSKDDPTLRSYHKSQAQTAEKRRQGISRALDRMSKTEGVAEGSIEQRIAHSKKNNPLRASVVKKTNGYTALVTDTSTGKPSWFGGAFWQTPELAMGHAKAFVKGFPYMEQRFAQRFIDKNIDGIVEQGVVEGSQKWYPDAPVNDYAGHEYHKLSDDELERKRADQKERHEKLGDTKAGKNADIARGIQVHRVRQGVAEGSLNEFAPGAGGDDEAGDDPYKYPKPKRYNRSADYFEQFEADHFDRQDFDDDTGVFKGYWGNTQIAYFKFDNPARTGGNNPGMGWYYEPQTNNRGDNTAAAPAADDSAERKQQELSMINAFLKSGNRPNTDSQIGRLMKKHGVAEGSTTRGGFGGSASQAQHEIQWLKNKIETLKPLLAKKPSVARQIKDLERQIRERELAISYQKEGVAEGLNDTQKKIEDTINKLENRLKHAKTDEQWDRIKDRIERLQAGLKRSKQGVAEGSGPENKMTVGQALEIAKKNNSSFTEKDYYDLIIRNEGLGSSFFNSEVMSAIQKKQGVAEGLEESYIIIRTDAEGKKDMFAKFSTYEKAQKELDGLLDHPLHTKYKQKFEIKRKGGEQGVAEEQLTEQDLAEAVSTLELADFLFKGLEQKFPKIIERYGHEVVGNAIMDVAEENLDVSSVSEVDMLIDDIIEKLQNYNDNDSGLTESTVSRLYYNVVGTSAPELRKDFGMRHDRQGWFLSESSGRNRIMDAQRAFGSPKLVEYSVSDATGGAAQLGPDNVVSPVGSVPKSQRINTKKARK